MYYAIDRKPPVADHALESYGIVPSHAIFSARETKKNDKGNPGRKERETRPLFFLSSSPVPPCNLAAGRLPV